MVVLASSVVRGPFVPPGLKDQAPWHAVLRGLLGPRTGLAGGAVSCVQPQQEDERVQGRAGEQQRGGQDDPLQRATYRSTGYVDPGLEPLPPFVEFTVIAATPGAVGVLLQLQPPDLPACTAGAAAAPSTDAPLSAPDVTSRLLAGDGLTAGQAVAMAALRAWSAGVLQSGWGLAALAARQAGVDWRDRATWACNQGVNPAADHANDGVSLSPFEALFVPLGGADRVDFPYGTPHDTARRHAEWVRQRTDAPAGQAPAGGGPPIGPAAGGLGHGEQGRATPQPQPLLQEMARRNLYVQAGPAFRLHAVLQAVAMGEQCFDVHHYLTANPDLLLLPSAEVWKWWVFQGQFQPRPYRLLCGIDWSKYGMRLASGAARGWARGADRLGGQPVLAR